MSLKPTTFTSSLTSLVFLTLISGAAFSQQNMSAAELKKLDVEELMNIRVTLASRTSQPISEVASAIQVLSFEDIKRSGATNIPEALRLIPNIQVAQLNAHAWIIGVRGFNTLFSNKLLVMIDGRTIYTPLFGGVIWDMQNLLLEDVDRIEVVSGPGGSLWGANAVNGVINIVTKNSKATEGVYVSATAGSFLRDNFEARYGGKLGNKASFRIYGQHFDRKPTSMQDDTKNTDEWRHTLLGFRIDYDPTEADAFSLQGNISKGLRKTTPEKSPFNSQNLNASWTRKVSDKSDFTLQAYFDRYFREDIPGTISDEMNTADVDFQYRVFTGRHQILWGAGYRYVSDNAKAHTQFVAILPAKKNLDLFNAFIQDEFSVTDKLKITAGTKFLHNVYTGIEVQPTLRGAYSFNRSNNLWAAVSRAVRTPSRFDRDYYIPAVPVPPPGASVAGGPNFESESLIAYELGYRVQPTSVSQFSASVFFNDYSNLYSVDSLTGTHTYNIMNNTDAESWGVEISGSYQLTPAWRLRGGYTYIDKTLTSRRGFNPDYLANDAKHRLLVHSILDLPYSLQFDVNARWIGKLAGTLATQPVPSYFNFDARLAWVNEKWEVAVTGQNLAKAKHTEFGNLNIPRSFYIKLATRF